VSRGAVAMTQGMVRFPVWRARCVLGALVAAFALLAARSVYLQALRTDVGAMAVDLASRVVGESLEDVARQRRIVERFIEGLEQPDGARPDADQARTTT